MSDEEVTMQPGGDSDSGTNEDADTSETSIFGEVDAISDTKWVLLQMSMPIAIWMHLYDIHNYDSHVHMMPCQAQVPVYFYKNVV